MVTRGKNDLILFLYSKTYHWLQTKELKIFRTCLFDWKPLNRFDWNAYSAIAGVPTNNTGPEPFYTSLDLTGQLFRVPAYSIGESQDIRVWSISNRSTATERYFERGKRGVDPRCSAVDIVEVHFTGNKSRILEEVHFYQHVLGETWGKCPQIWWKIDKKINFTY